MSLDHEDSSLEISRILTWLKQEEWERVKHHLSTLNRCSDCFRLRIAGTILIESSFQESVPLQFFRDVVKWTGQNVVLVHQDDTFRTPLHALMTETHRPDLVQYLVQEAGAADYLNRYENNNEDDESDSILPLLLEILDHSGLRPIEVLAQQILMKEEVLRYLQKSSSAEMTNQPNQDQQQMKLEAQRLHDCWECARILCCGHATVEKRAHDKHKQHQSQHQPNQPQRLCSVEFHWPTMHACFLAKHSIPLSLRSLVTAKADRDLKMTRTNEKEVKNSWLEQDSVYGNTPLHIVAGGYRFRVPSLHNENTEEEVEDEEEEDILLRVIQACPEANRIKNFQNQYPLDLAIAAGRTWATGCHALLQVYPPALVPNQIIGKSLETRNNQTSLQSIAHVHRGKLILYWILVREQVLGLEAGDWKSSESSKQVLSLEEVGDCVSDESVHSIHHLPGIMDSPGIMDVVFQILRARPQIISD